jgi:hypothetical protein
MGIENTALDPKLVLTQSVVRSPDRCVRFLCEKQCYTSQRQPTWALVPYNLMRTCLSHAMP